LWDIYNRRIVVQVGLGKEQDSISKIRAKRAGDMALVGELLPPKCKALSSNPSIAKRKKKKSIYSLYPDHLPLI
jgi:hypothetical protein